MGKKAGKGSRHDDSEVPDLDPFTAEDFDWLDDRAKVAVAAPGPPDLARGQATRTLRQLEMALLPAVATARDLFRAVARGQSHPPPDPALVSIFKDYRHYLHEWHATLATDGEEPNELFGEYDESIGHVLGCLDTLLRGEGISRVEALRADAWLHDVPGETLLFN